MAYITSDTFFGTMSVLFRYKVQTDMGGNGVCALKKDTHFLHTEFKQGREAMGRPAPEQTSKTKKVCISASRSNFHTS